MKKLKGKEFMEAIVEGAVRECEGPVVSFEPWSYFVGVYATVKEMARQGFLTKGQADWLDGRFFECYHLVQERIAESALPAKEEALP